MRAPLAQRLVARFRLDRRLAVAGLAAMAGPLALAAAPAAAQPLNTFATATLTHSTNFGGSPATRSVSLDNNVNPGIIPLNPSSSVFQLPNATLSNGGASTTARAGISLFSDPTNFGVRFTPGTRVTQTGNTNPASSTASSITITFDTRWFIESPYGPSISAGGSLNLSGTLGVGSQSYVRANLSAVFEYDSSGGSNWTGLRSPIASAPFYNQNGVPTGTTNFLASPSNMTAATPGTLGIGWSVHIAGTLTLLLHNDPGDLASVDVNFAELGLPIPAPAPAAALGLGALVAARRRRC